MPRWRPTPGFPVSATDSRLVTVAYDADIGAELWATQWNCLVDGTDNGKVIVVIAYEREVYLGGITTTAAGDLDYLPAWLRHTARPGAVREGTRL